MSGPDGGSGDLPRVNPAEASRRRVAAEAAEYKRLGPDVPIVAEGILAYLPIFSGILQSADPRSAGINRASLAEIATTVNIPALLQELKSKRLSERKSEEPIIEPTIADLRIEALDKITKSGVTTTLKSVNYLIDQLMLLHGIPGSCSADSKTRNALDFLKTVWRDQSVRSEPGFDMQGHVIERDFSGEIISISDSPQPVSVYEEVTGQRTPGRRQESFVRVEPRVKARTDLAVIRDQETDDDKRAKARAATEDVVATAETQTGRGRMLRPVGIDRSVTEQENINVSDIIFCVNLASDLARIQSGEGYNVTGASTMIRRRLSFLLKGEEALLSQVFKFEETQSAVKEILRTFRNGRTDPRQPLRAVDMAALLYLLHPNNRAKLSDRASWMQVYNVTRRVHAELNEERQ